jgi:ectoine hydroxylase-related dioxygenase (phytanoyl-CoA dioxygenase family)
MATAAAPAATSAFPVIDAARQDALTQEQADFFRDNGLLVIRNVVRGEELAALQRETQVLVDQARAGCADPDYMYREHEITGERVPFRVEYVIDKCTATKALLGHPFILRSVEQLQGRNFVPTWDSMVFKNPGAGVAIPWHRDAGTGNIDTAGSTDWKHPIFNVDFYLDRADLSNCLWGILGTNRWSNERADAVISELNAGGFQHGHGAVPIIMEPGDVIFHNITAIHGSPPAQSALRRVLYYEFRPGEVERKMGPHVPIYIPLKQRVLEACLRHRAQAAYAQGEKPFAYDPSPEFRAPELVANERLSTYRYPHHEYWRP